jgi:hypothetical protein
MMIRIPLSCYIPSPVGENHEMLFNPSYPYLDSEGIIKLPVTSKNIHHKN